MKRILVFMFFLVIFSSPLFSYKLWYAEQIYELYHRNLYQSTRDIDENIYYLEYCLRRPLANPLNALAVIETKEEWRKYKYLFYMHVNLELIRQYRLKAAEFDKRRAYFYNAPWKEENLKNLALAKYFYEQALYYWDEAQKWSALAYEQPYIYLEEIQKWEDENYMIETGELDYAEIIDMDLSRVTQVIADFEAMDENTY
jgi:tRNA A37 threonylcarbamoyladenosine biosynthesis protein TsaE